MNQEVLYKAVTQVLDPGLLGVLAIFLCPMIFGGITFYYSHKYTHDVTMKWWKQAEKDVE
jgi:hypothetical protein